MSGKLPSIKDRKKNRKAERRLEQQKKGTKKGTKKGRIVTEGCYQELLGAVAKGSGAGNSKGGAEPSAKDCGDPRARQAGGEGAQQGRKARQSINYINYINSRLEMGRAAGGHVHRMEMQNRNGQGKVKSKPAVNRSPAQGVPQWCRDGNSQHGLTPAPGIFLLQTVNTEWNCNPE